MEGVVNHTMRNILTSLGGIDRCVTEFVRVTDHLFPDRVFYRFCPELSNGGLTAAGTPVYVQLLGGKPEPMAMNANRAAQLGARGIDLNFGCPAKIVNRNDGGSVLLQTPRRLHEITTAVRRAVPLTVPVTVKMRLGYEDASLLNDNADAVFSAGATELTIHARTKSQGYKPPAFWRELEPVCQRSPIPVIANGEIWSVADYLECLRQSGCDDVMIGRGLLARPDLAQRIKQWQAGEVQQPLSWSQMVALLVRLLDESQPYCRPKHACDPVKQWLGYLRRGYQQGADLFEAVKRIKDPLVFRAALLDWQARTAA